MRGVQSPRGTTRRGLLAASAAATTGAVLVGTTPAAEAATTVGSAPVERTADVVVIGAGISGLTAAYRLLQAGVGSVVVLEANDRVGGRTVNLDVAPGIITEGGGQWVGPGQDRILGLIGELGLATFDTYVQGNNLYVRKGARKTYTGNNPPLGVTATVDYLQVQTKLEQMAATVPADAPWSAPQAVAWDGISFGDWLADNSLDTESRWLLTVAFTIINGEDPHCTSFLRVLHSIKTCGGIDHMMNVTGGGQQSRVVGGSQRISLALADRLGDRVVLASPVTSIEQTGASVLVRSGSVNVTCKQVIVAMAPADAARIDFSPNLPVRRAELQRKWHNGTESKLFAVYDRPFWRTAGLSGQAITDLPATPYVIDNSPPDGSLGILLTFMGTAGSGSGVVWSDAVLDDPVVRRSTVLSSLTTLFGPQAATPLQFLEKDWVHEKWIEGCVSSRSPGLLTGYTDAGVVPVGRVHWAGTEAATVSYDGYMEGAVLAAERAVAEVRAAL